MVAAGPVASLACALITQYQRHLSPRKGFSCAYRVRRGRDSCSVFGKRAIARTGVLQGVVLLRRRFRRCHVASRRLEYEGRKESGPRAGGMFRPDAGPKCGDMRSCSTEAAVEFAGQAAVELAGDACCAVCHGLG
jgi:putative component of membrane protein insertase Oxa1/YidC/SpoIIIJ protein YidD